MVFKQIADWFNFKPKEKLFNVPKHHEDLWNKEEELNHGLQILDDSHNQVVTSNTVMVAGVGGVGYGSAGGSMISSLTPDDVLYDWSNDKWTLQENRLAETFDKISSKVFENKENLINISQKKPFEKIYFEILELIKTPHFTYECIANIQGLKHIKCKFEIIPQLEFFDLDMLKSMNAMQLSGLKPYLTDVVFSDNNGVWITIEKYSELKFGV